MRFAPMVQILDALVPQMVEQLPNILHFFDKLMPDPEQVIEVPKVLPDDVPVRTAVRDTQLAEQLVEVPTIVSFSLLQQIMEQNVGIPVPGHGGRFAGLQGFSPLNRVQQRHRRRSFTFPFRGGGLQGFRPGQGSSSSHFPAGVHEDLDEPGVGGFRTFHQSKKKCGVRSPPESEGARQCQLIHASSSAPSLQHGHEPHRSEGASTMADRLQEEGHAGQLEG